MLRKLLNIFKNISKLSNTPNTLNNTQTSTKGWYFPLSARKLLGTSIRQQYLKIIWQNVSMSSEMFERLYKKPLEKYAEIVQLLPASESHHHSHLGGMLDHTLEVIVIATKLRQSYILPQNVAPEDQAKQRDIWTAIVIYGAILHDIGKITADIEIMLKDESRWFPWLGMPTQPYRFRYIKERDYNLHPTLGSFFMSYLFSDEILNWLANYHNAFSSLIYLSTGHYDKAGVLTEIIQKADQTSVALALGGDPNKLKAKEPTKISLAKQLQIALQHVVQHFKLNAPKGGCDGWLTSEGLWVMSKTTADAIRAYLMQQGIPISSQNGKVFDELQAHHLIEKSSDSTAIWSCRVISDIGWAPPKPFSLLKIDPNIIWDSIDKRPDLFKGRVNVIGDETNREETEEVVKLDDELNLSNTENVMQKLDDITTLKSKEKEKTPTEPVNDDDTALDYALSLFEPVNNETEALECDSQNQEKEIDIRNTKQNAKQKKTDKNSEESQDVPVIAITNKQQKTQTEQKEQSSPVDAKKFIEWIKLNIVSGKLHWNRPDAKLHIVEQHLFLVTPSLFQIYLQEVANISDKPSWELLQKHFQSLGIHKRQHMKNDSKNIWTCSIVGPKRQSKLNGYLIEDTKLFFGDKVLFNNQWLKLQGTLE